MPLTFNVPGLIKMLDDVQAAVAKADARYAKDCEAARKKHHDEWSKNKEGMRALRDYLTKSLKNDTPPTSEAAKEASGQTNNWSSEGVKFFIPGDGGVSRQPLGYVREDELAGMRALLAAHQGDTITATQLKELGTHPRDLQKLFRAATLAGVAK